MRGTRTVLALGLLNLVLITGPSMRVAADECLAKPNGPTPRGQHWYYRIDHANNGRQCWYLRAENTRAPKNSLQAETDPAEAMAQSIQAPAPRAGSPEASVGEMARESSAPVAAKPIPWLNVQKFPEPISFPQPVIQQKPAPQTQADSVAATAASGTASEHVIDSPAARPAPSAGSNAAPVPRAREPQRRQQMQVRPEPPAPAIARVDHTFALLMVMFAALAIAGPALHFVERRRREAANFRPPPWARVVALNAPKPRIRVMPRQKIANASRVPVPIRPPDQTERLAHALQQLVDRLQTSERPEPKAIRIRPRERASM